MSCPKPWPTFPKAHLVRASWRIWIEIEINTTTTTAAAAAAAAIDYIIFH
jgi:hypothetical protein